MISLQNNPKQNKKLSHAEIYSLTKLTFKVWSSIFLLNLQQAITGYKLNWEEGQSKISESGAQRSNEGPIQSFWSV